MKLKNILFYYLTVGDKKWLIENEQSLKSIFPKTYTHIDNLDKHQILNDLESLGINLISINQFKKVIVRLEKIGIILRDGYSIKANSNNIFTK